MSDPVSIRGKPRKTIQPGGAKRKGGKGHVTCVGKANVFKTFAFFRKIFKERTLLCPDISTGFNCVDAINTQNKGEMDEKAWSDRDCVRSIWCWKRLRSRIHIKSDDLSGQLTEMQVFSGFGCTGKNISPSLKWTGAPEKVKSFAVTIYDPDAPTGSGWWHWLIFNIPPDISELKTDAGNPQKNLAPKGSI